MIREQLQQLKTEPRDLRKFGLLVGGVFALIGLWFWLRHKPYYLYPFYPAAPLLLLGAVWPRALKHIYLGWMAMAFVLGHIMSTLLLLVFFFLAVTPLGLLARWTGKDFLGVKLNRQAGSYWLRRRNTAPAKSSYEQQY